MPNLSLFVIISVVSSTLAANWPEEPGLKCHIQRETMAYPKRQCTRDVIRCLYSDEAKRYIWHLIENFCPPGYTFGFGFACAPADCEGIAFTECTWLRTTTHMEPEDPCSPHYYKCLGTMSSKKFWYPYSCGQDSVYDPTMEPTWRDSCKQDLDCLREV